MNNTKSPTPCPDGRGPDLLFRFGPIAGPVAPFAQTGYGEDCDMSLLGHDIFGGIALAYTFICLFAHLATIPSEKNNLFLAVRLVHCAILTVVIAAIIVGWVAPAQSYILGVMFLIMFMSTGLLWIYLGYQTVIKTIVSVELGKNVTVFSLLGGAHVLYCFALTVGLTYLAEVVSLIVLAVSKSQGDFVTAVTCYRVAFGCVALGISTFAVAVFIVLTKFLSLLDTVIRSRVHGSSEAVDKLKEVFRRFRFARIVLPTLSLFTATILILNVVFLPLFWFLILLHFVTVCNSCFAVFFAITPRSRRNFLCRWCGSCCRMNRPKLPPSESLVAFPSIP